MHSFRGIAQFRLPTVVPRETLAGGAGPWLDLGSGAGFPGLVLAVLRPQDEVVLVDTIGELRNWWGTAQIATVGGSFGARGGQNMLEPAGYGCAVSFGPNTRNFQEIAEALIAADGAVRVQDASELKQFVRRCLTDVPAADSLGQAARHVINRHRGATNRTIAAICKQSSRSARRAA